MSVLLIKLNDLLADLVVRPVLHHCDLVAKTFVLQPGHEQEDAHAIISVGVSQLEVVDCRVVLHDELLCSLHLTLRCLHDIKEGSGHVALGENSLSETFQNLACGGSLHHVLDPQPEFICASILKLVSQEVSHQLGVHALCVPLDVEPPFPDPHLKLRSCGIRANHRWLLLLCEVVAMTGQGPHLSFSVS